jgi:hypothetical protein
MSLILVMNMRSHNMSYTVMREESPPELLLLLYMV